MLADRVVSLGLVATGLGRQNALLAVQAFGLGSQTLGENIDLET